MKRSNINSQQRKEDVDNDDDDNEENQQGTFNKASEEELKNRKIIKIKRKIPGSTEDIQAPKIISNPFASLGNSFLINPSATISIPSSITANSSNNVISTDNIRTNDEFTIRIKKLNESFSKWMDKQINENSYSLWIDAARDYIKYANEIVEKYGKTVHTNQSISITQPDKTKSSNTLNDIKSNFSFSNKEILNTPQEKSVIPSFPSFTLPKQSDTKAASEVSSKPSFQFSLSSSNSVNPANPTINFSGFKATTDDKVLPQSNESSLPKGGFQFPPFSSQPSTTFQGFGQLPSLPKLGQPLSFPSLSTSLSSNNNPNGNDDEDGEGEPILEPEKAIRNKDDNDVILYESNSKILKFDKKATEWKDMGKGTFRITKTVDTGKHRMLMRSLTGKIMFNASFYYSMKFDKIKGGIKFNAFVVDEQSKDSTPELQMFIVKVKESEISKLYDKLVESAATVTK